MDAEGVALEADEEVDCFEAEGAGGSLEKGYCEGTGGRTYFPSVGKAALAFILKDWKVCLRALRFDIEWVGALSVFSVGMSRRGSVMIRWGEECLYRTVNGRRLDGMTMLIESDLHNRF